MFPLATVFQDQSDCKEDSSTFNHLNENETQHEQKLSNGPVTEKFEDGVDDIMEWFYVSQIISKIMLWLYHGPWTVKGQ